jgi:hypothetical protein
MDPDLEGWKRVVERRLADLEARLQPAVVARSTASKPLSVGEFLRSKRPGSALDMAVAIAYHLEKHEGLTPFTLADLRRGFIKAKEPLPVNSRDLVHRALKLGLMMQTGSEREGFRTLILTNSGELYVENGFKDSGR